MGTVLTSIITSGTVAIFTGVVTYLIQERKLKIERQNLSNQFQIERERLAEQYKTERRADAALSKFLNHVKFTRRSFDFIRERIGSFEDDELRKMLVRNGAIRKIGKDKKEWWELLEEYKTSDNEAD